MGKEGRCTNDDDGGRVQENREESDHDQSGGPSQDRDGGFNRGAGHPLRIRGRWTGLLGAHRRRTSNLEVESVWAEHRGWCRGNSRMTTGSRKHGVVEYHRISSIPKDRRPTSTRPSGSALTARCSSRVSTSPSGPASASASGVAHPNENVGASLVHGVQHR